jgi:glycosyltransferase involved in cell wall biosynthesis
MMYSADRSLLRGISVVVPVYNSEDSLGPLLERLEAVLTGIGQPFEVLLVNDGSRDRSWETITRLAATRPWLRGINLMRNYGQHNALLCGIRQVRFDRFITIDDDLQNPPEEIPRLLAKLEDGFDVVYGTPDREQHGLWRDLASQVTKMALQTAMGVDVARKVSAFRAIRTQVREAFGAYRGPFVSIDVLLTWGTARFAAIIVRHDERRIGISNYSLTKLVIHALNMMTGFSIKPLQVASVIGFGFTLFGIGILFYVLIRYALQGARVPGFPFLASVIAIFSGVQLFALGIIGEYLARMHFRMMDRPSYTVRETAGAGDEQAVGTLEEHAIR